MMFAGDVATHEPDLWAQGWMPCDGRPLSRTEYSALFEVVSDKYGTGDGATTFNVPNLCGRVAIGAGTGKNAVSQDLAKHDLASAEGSEGSLVTGDHLPPHAHDRPNHAHVWLKPGGGADVATQGSYHSAARAANTGEWYGLEINPNAARPDLHGGLITDDAGGGPSSNPTNVKQGANKLSVMQPTIALNFIIRFG
jgi:microcystin-dependent protein